MGLINVHSYLAGQWLAADDGARPIASAVTGEPLAIAGQAALDTQAMIDFAKQKGGPALRAMSFHDRARMLKALALELGKFKDELYALSYTTGATRSDSMIDIDGGIGTMLVYASKGRREMPDGHIYVDGDLEMLSRGGTFVGQHVATSLQGVAVHINAFNFPVWGMLEKLAPTLLAGMPAIVKPATATCHVTEQCVRRMIESGILPEGAVQLVSGGLGDLLDRLDYQDVVGFTGSAKTALMLRSNPILLEKSVRFVAEQDSLNASVLGPDVTEASPEFDILVKEVVREMTAKAGQKCTAIRRIIVPESLLGPVGDAIAAKLGSIRIGDPALETTRMGALASAAQKADVLDKARQIAAECRQIAGDQDTFEVHGADKAKGAFVAPMLFACDDPDAAQAVHSVEAFGPVATLMPYRDLAHAGQLMNRGRGSLVASVITHDPAVARSLLVDAGAAHGRIYVNNRDSAREATGHGPYAAAARNSAASAASCTTCSAPRSRAVPTSSPESPAPGSRAQHGRNPPPTPSPAASTNLRSATPSRPARAQSRWKTSRPSPISPATRFTPTWTRKRPRPTRSSPAGSPTATCFCPSPRASSSPQTPARCWPIPASTG